MIDLTKVRNYYIACGYTDLRLGIDGLAAVVTQQYGSHKEDGKPATSESRMWLYASVAPLKHQVRLFEYQPDRSGKRPEAFLKGFGELL